MASKKKATMIQDAPQKPNKCEHVATNCENIAQESQVGRARRPTRPQIFPSGRTWPGSLTRGRVLSDALRGPPRIVTLRGSARGSYLEILPQQNQIMPSISKICPLPVHKVPHPPKFLPKPLQNPPKTFPEPLKIDPKSSQKASWTPS